MRALASRRPSNFRLNLTRRSRLSWTSWSRRSRERQLRRAEKRLRLLELAEEMQALRVRELEIRLLPAQARHQALLALMERSSFPPQAISLNPVPEPEPREMHRLVQVTREELLPEELEPMPSAEEQLGSLLAGPLTPPRSRPSSES